MKYRTARSPPKNYKVSFIEQPPFNKDQKNFFMTTVPRIAKTFTTSQQIQFQLSQQLCRYLKKSVGVSVVVKPQNYSQEVQQKFLKAMSFRCTMNEFLYRIWIQEQTVQPMYLQQNRTVEYKIQ